MKNRKLIIALIVILSIIALLLAGILALCLVYRAEPLKINTGDFKESQQFFSESYDGSTVNSIKVNSDCGDIEILNSNDSSVQITADGKYKNGLSVNNDNGELSVTYKSQKRVNLKSLECDITIYLPKDFNKPVSLDLSCGDVDAGEVSNIKISNSYGDIEIGKVSKSFEISSSYGDIDIGIVDISNNSSIQSSMGDISIDKTNDIRIDSNVSMGDNDVRYSSQSSDIVLTVSADLGDIEIN